MLKTDTVNNPIQQQDLHKMMQKEDQLQKAEKLLYTTENKPSMKSNDAIV